jgi:hypothetical protein
MKLLPFAIFYYLVSKKVKYLAKQGKVGRPKEEMGRYSEAKVIKKIACLK